MEKRFGTEERLLLELLKISLGEAVETDMGKRVKAAVEIAGEKENPNMTKLFDLADSHGVTALIYNVFLEAGVPLNPELESKVRFKSNATVLQNYHLLFLGKTIVEKLKENKIEVLVLKGCSTAAFYPVPELRKTGDLDLLLLNEDDLKKTSQIFAGLGIRQKEEQSANHHISYRTKDGIEIELHIMLAEPFASEKINRYLKRVAGQCRNHKTEIESMGVNVWCLGDGYHGYYLLLHMLQHFLRAGFGVKLFCDWTAFWNKEKSSEEEKIFLQLVHESGLYGFAERVTAACIAYLGLPPESAAFLFGRALTVTEAEEMSRQMMLDVLEAEEFGHSGAERMVVLKDRSLAGYVREFHHQMQLNFPKAGRIFLLWPILWIRTLLRFLINNKKIRKVSMWTVFQKAGDRSRLIKDLKLFEDE